MKTFQKLTMLMSVFVLLSAIPTMAQINSKVIFDAPFAFYVGNAKMPAGSYTVTQQDDNPELLLIESANGSQSVFVEYVRVQSDIPDTPASKTEVTFNKYGKTDFLSRISLQGQTSGMQILASKAEQNAAKAAAAEKHTLSAKK